MDLDQIVPNLFVGSCPAEPEDIDRLARDFGVAAVLNLQTDEDFDYWDLDWHRLQAHYRESGVEIHRVPVRDFDQEDLQKKLPDCVATLAELVDRGQAVYLHCNLGAGRSPSVAIAYLHWVGKWDLEAATRHVQAARPCSPNVEAIRLATDDWLNGRGPDEGQGTSGSRSAP